MKIPLYNLRTAANGFSFSYDEKDDTFILMPVDEEWHMDLSDAVAFTASDARALIETLPAVLDEMLMQRRAIRGAVRRGIDPAVVQARFEARFVAEVTDRQMREMMK